MNVHLGKGQKKIWIGNMPRENQSQAVIKDKAKIKTISKNQ